jgi:hypothetical protein
MGAALSAPLSRRQTAQLGIQLYALHEGLLGLLSETDEAVETWLEAVLLLGVAEPASPELDVRKQDLSNNLEPFDFALLKSTSGDWIRRGLTARVGTPRSVGRRGRRFDPSKSRR